MSSRTWGAVVVAVWMCLCVYSIDPSAQTLVVSPTCGLAGVTKGCITGSGWAEPAPVCRYKFFFDGAVVAPDQPDGLFGPPNRQFTVPAGKAPGTYKVRVELRLNSPDSLLQQKEVPFDVVAALKDPWTAGPTGPRIDIAFNPKDVCDVTPCKKIVMMQFMKGTGTKPDGTTEDVNWVDWNHPQGAELEKNKVNNVTEDGMASEKDPYYNGGSDAVDIGSPGKQDASPTTSKMDDTVNYPDSAYKAGFNKLTIEFEVAAFCAEGHDAGAFLGVTKWTWSRTKGAAAVITVNSKTRDLPSSALTDALAKWSTNHSFTLPTSSVPACF